MTPSTSLIYRCVDYIMQAMVAQRLDFDDFVSRLLFESLPASFFEDSFFDDDDDFLDDFFSLFDFSAQRALVPRSATNRQVSNFKTTYALIIVKV